MTNVNITEYVHGDNVKLKLRPGAEPLIHRYGGPHEEGFSYTEDRWWVSEEGKCFFSTTTRSRDCDGPMDSWATFSKMPKDDAWEKEDRGQRDYFAEAAGY